MGETPLLYVVPVPVVPVVTTNVVVEGVDLIVYDAL
ncbi:unannotated protein [freshwater metagenome]|uniref:Unannotated protein n=1 Tax=freshwater metagenome TaxID=449393 RepID=A0A6J7KAF4_9ZZZZ